MVAEPFDLISLRSAQATTPTVVVRVDPGSLNAEIIVDTAFVKGSRQIRLSSDDIAEWEDVLEALDNEEGGSWLEGTGQTGGLTVEWDEDDDYIWVTVEARGDGPTTVRTRVAPDEYWLDDQFNRLATFRQASPELDDA
jgi:uncharacterized protein DUF5959